MNPMTPINPAPRLGFARTIRSMTIGLSAAMIAATSAFASTIIYSDDFSGSAATNLNGLAPDVRSGTDGGSASATWTSYQTNFHADGSVAGVNTGTAGQAIEAYLPFTPNTGNIYTLTIDLNPGNSASVNWMAVGFTNNLATTNSFSYGGNASWVIYSQRGDGSAKSSGNTNFSTGATFGSNTGVSDPMRVTITLDTTAALWSTTYSTFNLTTSTIVGSSSFAYTTNPSITGIFIGSLLTTGTVDNLQLSVAAIPEPSSFAFLAGGMALVLAGCSRRVSGHRLNSDNSRSPQTVSF